MLPKGKCICMLKRKFCVANFLFLTILMLFVFLFFSFTPALKALVSFFFFNFFFQFFFLKIRVKSSFSPSSLLEGADAGCLILRSYFYPTSLTFGDGKSGKKPKCSFFITKSAVEPKNE